MTTHLSSWLNAGALLLACAGCAGGTPAAESAAAPAEPGAPHGYDVREETLAAVPLAVARDRAWVGNVGPQILSLMTRLEQRGWGSRGSDATFVIYRDTAGSDEWTHAPGIPIEVGVPLREAPTPQSDGIFRSQTPGGQVAHTTHVGPYRQLGDAHAAIHDWCEQNGKHITGVRWEAYDPDRSHAPEGLRTDVYYVLE